MKKRQMIGKAFFYLIVAIAILHTAVHFVSFEGKIVGLTEEGISGFSIGKFAVGEEILESYPIGSSFSRLIVIGEWFFVLLFALFFYANSRIDFMKEVVELKTIKNSSNSEYSTDLDRLYGLLKNRKRVSFKAVAEVFDIDVELAKEWGDTLKSGGLANIEYPRVGDAELVLKENN